MTHKDEAFDRAMKQLERVQTEKFQWLSSYEYLRDAIIGSFNPPDEDAAEDSVMKDAITRAFNFIETTPCACTWHEEPNEDVCDTCKRCEVLGREFDVMVER
jgi:hypothetical protein